MTFGPRAIGAVCPARRRWLWLKFQRRVGRFQRSRLYHGLPLIGWLAATALALAGVQVLVNQVLHDLPVWSWLGVARPEIHVLSLTGVIVTYLLVMFGLWLSRARTRVVVDDFVDFTTNDAKAVSGLATLLATELSRLRSLYTSINDTLAVPIAVGAHSQAAPGRDAEPGSFLTVRADDLSDMLQNAVASEAKVQAGPLLIPVGNIAAIFGRLARGPRLLGSVHRTESGGGPTLTAQIVGGKQKATWRVDRSHLSPSSPAEDKAFLDEMVRELAIEMFTDLTMQGAVRWRAIRTFTEYLRDYRASMRTPKTRSRFLKEAEEKLLEAIAEDEQFDFAYYNLGVIYSQLALAELNTARQWDTAPEEKVKPQVLHGSRMQAATIAFTRAIERNRNRWEAYYALAVHHMTRFKRKFAEEDARELRDDDLAALREVERLCDRVLESDPRNAEAYDLKGMAIWFLVKVGEDASIDESIACHNKAVRLAWGNLCREERRAHAEPPTAESALPRREENATAALHNLAAAYALKANGQTAWHQRHARKVNFRRADTFLKLAIKLAPPGSAARLHSQRARFLRRRATHTLARDPRRLRSLRLLLRQQRRRRRLARARRAYYAAAEREPEHPLYLAQLARAYAETTETAADVAEIRRCIDRACHLALKSLAPVWRRALSHTPSRADQRLTKWTFNALAETYDALARATDIAGDEQTLRACAARLREMDRLGEPLQENLATPVGRRKARGWFDSVAQESPAGTPQPLRGIWIAEQIGVALARAYVRGEKSKPSDRKRNLHEAVNVLDTLIELSKTERESAIQAHDLEIRKANGLRRLGDKTGALEWVSKGLMRDPLSERGRAELAEIHMVLWQYDDALSAWEHTLWLKPNDPYVHFKLGLCHWWRANGCRDRDESNASLAKAAELMDQSHQLFSREDVTGRSWLRLWRGRVALERGQRDTAIMHLRAARGWDVCEPAARTFLGEAYLDGDEFSLAKGEFDRAITKARKFRKGDCIDQGWGDSLTPTELRARCERGRAAALIEIGEPADALEAAEASIKLAESVKRKEDSARIEALAMVAKARALTETVAAEERSAALKKADHALAEAISLQPNAAAYFHRAQIREIWWADDSDPKTRQRLLAEVLEFKDAIVDLDGVGTLSRKASDIATRMPFPGLSTNGNGRH